MLPQTQQTQRRIHRRSKEQIAADYLRKYYNDPVRWAHDYLGVYLWSKQREILESIFANNYTAVRSCHSAGKTFVAAVAVLAFLYTRTPCKIVTSAPTMNQVVDLLWAEIRHLHKTRLEPKEFPGEVLMTRLRVREDWFAIGISPRDPVNFHGWHQKHVLVIYDEAPGIRKEIIDGGESLMSSGDAHTLKIGNPVGPSGDFWDSFHDPDVKKIHIDCIDTPNFTKEPVPVEIAQELIDSDWVKRMARKYGEESPIYQSKCRGNFPDEAEDQLISLSLCEAAKIRVVEEKGKKMLGVDVARFGDDSTVFTLRTGLKIDKIQKFNKRDNVFVAGKVKEWHKRYGFEIANVDVVGLGSGVVDLCKANSVPVAGIASQGSPKGPDKKDYRNRRAELWFGGRDWLKIGSIPNDDDLVHDLITPKYIYTQGGKYQIESKKDIKKRRGKSPDHGDSFVLSVDELGKLEIYSSSTSLSADQALAKVGVR